MPGSNQELLLFRCVVDNCKSPVGTRVYCRAHHQLNRKYGNPTPEYICPEPSCLKSFVYKGNSTGVTHRFQIHQGKKPYCIECSDLLIHFENVIEKNCNSKITKVIYIKSLIEQGFSCKICLDKDCRLWADHNHSCCKYGCPKCFRGLLCPGCNWLVGAIENQGHKMDDAIKYIDSWGKLS